MQQFFYDAQIRRFLLQFTRIFSNFQIEYGRDDAANPTLIRVPVRYGDATRQAQTVIQNNSSSFLPSTPLITFYITGMNYDRPRMQEPYFVSRQAVRQRTYDTDTESYETTQGNAFTIERLMPVPYRMVLNADIWTSNTNQKLQLFEQIVTLFNPSLEIQSTDNFLDWTSLSVVELTETTWSSRSIPQGTEDPIDIMTMRFELPIWISSPARVRKLGVVERIIAGIYDERAAERDAVFPDDLLLGTRVKVSPWGYQVLLIGNKLQALKSSAVVNPTNNNTQPQPSPPSNEFWQAIVGSYGTLRPGISQIRLESPWDATEIIGTVSFDPTDDRFLLFDVDPDTVPQNTLDPVDAVIDPLASGPGTGLAPAALGQRYLILDRMGPGVTQAWGDIRAEANDIIEYTDTGWTVAFDHRRADSAQFVTNITTSLQYRWTGEEWVKSYEGVYTGGNWSLVL